MNNSISPLADDIYISSFEDTTINNRLVKKSIEIQKNSENIKSTEFFNRINDDLPV